MENKIFLVQNHHHEMVAVVATDEDQVAELLREGFFGWRRMVEVGVAKPELEQGVIANDDDMFYSN